MTFGRMKYLVWLTSGSFTKDDLISLSLLHQLPLPSVYLKNWNDFQLFLKQHQINVVVYLLDRDVVVHKNFIGKSSKCEHWSKKLITQEINSQLSFYHSNPVKYIRHIIQLTKIKINLLN